MAPKRVKVIRLFNREKIDDELFDPRKVDRNSDKWISIERNNPGKADIFFVKNDDEVFKAIYLFMMPFITPSNWFHTVKDEFISKEKITHWMPIPRPQTSEESQVVS